MLTRLDLSVFCPADLAICQGVFDQICAKRTIARATEEAKLTANAVLVLFQLGFIEESELFVAAIRFIDRNGGWRKSSPSENPAGRRGAGLRRRAGVEQWCHKP
ncbi:MAG: hypothetical protein JF620_00030 [Mesorhizobium sp.]|nr:hypothetical protein [Mesorhizobium sp.]